ncbi:MAG: polysaccharide pyruvyl transferase family protein [Brachybacterium sp.]|nr:polysaccharide pyruvyl transferase family protein [Brachybacterium sp.]
MASYPNFGDELIARRWLEHLARHRPADEVWLDCRHPGTATALFGGIHPNLRVTDAVFRTVEDSLRGSRRSVEDIVTGLGTPLYDAPLLALREAQSLHLLGGGFVNAVWPENDLLVEALRAASRVSGAPLIATGQGLAPFGSETLQGFAHVSVRDAPSAQRLGIPQGVDDAYLVEALPVPDRSAPPELVLCVQSDAIDDGAFERLLGYVRRTIERSGIPRERVRYVEALPGGDYAGYDRLRDVVAEDGFIPFTRFWGGEFAPAAHQIWITTRFHHHLVASLHGARGIALTAKAGYYDVKHRSLVDGGSSWSIQDGSGAVLDLEELPEPASAAAGVETKTAEAQLLYGGV